MELVQSALSLCFVFLQVSKRISGDDNCSMFLLARRRHVIQPTVSTHWRELKALTLTRKNKPLLLSFLDLPEDFRGNGNSLTLYARFPKSVPSISTANPHN